MTEALQQAIAQLQQLPADQQDLLAGLLLHEIEEDKKWIESTEAHADKLSAYVKDILAADDRGECEPLIPDEL